MNDQLDPHDDNLTRRLRNHELRVPLSAAPDPASVRQAKPPWLAIGVAVAGLSVVLALLLPRLMQPVAIESSSSPSASSSVVGTASSSATASPAASSTPAPTPVPTIGPTTDLEWTSAGSFPSDGGLSMVNDVVAVRSDLLVAVGVSYDRPLPVFGRTPPHSAGIWTSNDGHAWEQIELDQEFNNVNLRLLTVRGDGSLLAMGSRGELIEEGGVDYVDDETEPVAWASRDGITWEPTASGLPATPATVVSGPKGYLAYISTYAVEGEQEIWHSADGFSWALSRTYGFGSVSIGAGRDGFVAAATPAHLQEDSTNEYLIEATGDGTRWVPSNDVPNVAFPDVLAHGGDWILINDDRPGDRRGLTWFSANGLEWARYGRIPLAEVALEPEAGPSDTCYEYVNSQMTAGPWLVVATELAYPCSESGYLVHGTQFFSVDGATWVALPLPLGVPGESRSGFSASGAAAINDSLILGGEEDGAATFWIGVPR